MINKYILRIALVIFFAFFALNIFLLSHYGISWDEPIHYIRGQAYLQYFLGKDDQLIKDKGVSIYQNYKLDKQQIANFSYWLTNDSGHPPLNGILASLSNYIFFQKLGIMQDIESYHLFIVFVSALLVAAVFMFTASIYGLFAGLIATLSITLYPLFFGESHFNIKDPVETAFYAATLIAFYKSITTKSWKWMIASSVAFGLSLGTKFNILFSIFTILPWLLIYSWKSIRQRIWPFSSSLTFSLLAYPFIALAILYATWPFLWVHPIANFLKILTYYKDIGEIVYQSNRFITVFGMNTFAVQWITFTTPLVILFLSLIGIIYALALGFKEKQKTALFVLLWLILPIIRVSLPSAGIYGGVRQIMEYIPAMAILSGIGAFALIKLLKQYIKASVYSLVLRTGIVLLFIPITITLIKIHPNENVYFNSLIGGLSGAKNNNIPYWGNSFGNAYKQGVNWLNSHAERNARVALAVGLRNNVFSLWFRKDINYSNEFRKDYLSKQGEYVIELTGDMPSWPNFCYWVYVKNFLQPIYEVRIDNVAILTIWKNDSIHIKAGFNSRDKLYLLDGCAARTEND